MTTYAGPSDSAQVTAGSIQPVEVKCDGAGGLFVVSKDGRIYHVAIDGRIEPVHGLGTNIRSITVDKNGNLYVYDGRVEKVSRRGDVSVFAGNGRTGFAGDGGPAIAAQFSGGLIGLAVDTAGNLFVADDTNNRVREVTKGKIKTIAGSGSPGAGGDGGAAASAQITRPVGVAIDADGTLYIAANYQIRKVTSDGTIRTIAGTGTPGFSGDGGPATSAQLGVVMAIAVDSTGTVYLAEASSHRVRRVTSDGVISTAVGGATPAPGQASGRGGGFGGDGGQAVDALLSGPVDIDLDASGNLYIADGGNNRVRKVTPAGVISTVIGGGAMGSFGDGGPATLAQLQTPLGAAFDAAGNLYIADTNHSRIRKVTPGGIISTVAGRGIVSGGFAGDGGPATSAQLASPTAVAVGSDGSIYIADTLNHRIRKISSTGVIETIAGSTPGFSGDGGQATAAQLASPSAIAVDASGNIYIADTSNNRIRRISAAGVITTVAGGVGFARGRAGAPGFSGDGGRAVEAQFNVPSALALDSAGNMYVADTMNNRVRKIDAAGVISTFAGTGVAGPAQDGKAAVSAQLNRPQGVAVDLQGNVFIADTGNHVVRKVTPNGKIVTVAGTGFGGFDGDVGKATSSRLTAPTGLAVDAAGHLFVVDTGNQRIRKIW